MVFTLDASLYAIELRRVEQVVRVVEIRPFPSAPEIVSGVFDLHGELVPVVNLRRRFRLAERAPYLSDQLMIARTSRRRLALLVDRVDGVVSVNLADLTEPENVVPGTGYVRGIMRLPAEGMVFIHDLDTFLSLDEETRLGAALERISP